MSNTPTPWVIEPNGSCFNVLRESGGSGHHLILVGMEYNQEGEHEANAVFIVRAVNAHEKLLAAVKMVFEAADDGGGMTDIDWDMLRDAYNIGLTGEA